MTDKELLELAAKAAGISEQQLNHPVNYWSPLTDDGDALRLAVKLGIHITNSITDAWATTLQITSIEPINNDPYAATRRAIVRAAAAIGETLA